MVKITKYNDLNAQSNNKNVDLLNFYNYEKGLGINAKMSTQCVPSGLRSRRSISKKECFSTVDISEFMDDKDKNLNKITHMLKGFLNKDADLNTIFDGKEELNKKPKIKPELLYKIPDEDIVPKFAEVKGEISFPKGEVERVDICNTFNPKTEDVKLNQKNNVNDMLKVRHYKDILDAHKVDFKPHEPITFTDNLQDGITKKNHSYTYFHSIIKKGSMSLHKASSLGDVEAYAMWIVSLYEDFNGNVNKKDAFHIFNDVVSVVPYVGDAMGIVVDIADGKYLDMLQKVGLLVACLVMPEFAGVLAIFGLAQVLVEGGKLLNNAFYIRDLSRDYLNSFKSFMFSNYDSQNRSQNVNAIYESINEIVDSIVQQQIYTLNAITHNIHYAKKEYLKRSKNKEQDEILINQTILHQEELAWEAIRESHRNIVDMFCDIMKVKILPSLKDLIKKNNDNMIEAVKNNFYKEVKDNYPGMPKRLMDDGLEYIHVNFNIVLMRYNLENLISDIEKCLNYQISAKKELDIPFISVAFNNKNVLECKTKFTKVTSKNIIPVDGRRKLASIGLKGDSEIRIQHDLLQTTSIMKDFTVSFWLQVPDSVEQRKLDASDSYISLVKHSYSSGGWEIGIHKKRLFFKTHISKSKVTYLNSNDDPYENPYKIIPYNKWGEIRVVNHAKHKRIEMFYNGKILGIHYYGPNGTNTDTDTNTNTNTNTNTKTNIDKDSKDNFDDEFKLNNYLKISIKNDHTKFDISKLRYKIDHICVYKSAVKTNKSYSEEHMYGLIYDYFGEPIKSGKEYNVISLYRKSSKEQLKESGGFIYSYTVYDQLHKQLAADTEYNVAYPVHDHVTREITFRTKGVVKEDDVKKLHNVNNIMKVHFVHNGNANSDGYFNKDDVVSIVVGDKYLSIRDDELAVDTSDSAPKAFRLFAEARTNDFCEGSYITKYGIIICAANNEKFILDSIVVASPRSDGEWAMLVSSNYIDSKMGIDISNKVIPFSKYFYRERDCRNYRVVWYLVPAAGSDAFFDVN